MNILSIGSVGNFVNFTQPTPTFSIGKVSKKKDPHLGYGNRKKTEKFRKGFSSIGHGSTEYQRESVSGISIIKNSGTVCLPETSRKRSFTKEMEKQEEESFSFDFKDISPEELDNFVDKMADLGLSCTVKINENFVAKKNATSVAVKRENSQNSQLTALIEDLRKIALGPIVTLEEREAILTTFDENMLWTDYVDKRELFHEIKDVFDNIQKRMDLSEAQRLKGLIQEIEGLL